MTPRTDKRTAILDGALEVFARDGYARASIDVIAKEAGVSTRTIYNHFQDKAALFRAVISQSAERVADSHTALIDDHLRGAADLEEPLTRVGLALTGLGKSSYASHFALVRHIQADAEHIPAEAVQAWREAGPLRVRHHLAERLAALPGLDLDDPRRAALHFLSLIGPDTVAGSSAPDEEHVRAAVRAFLNGYRR